ncbi:MAG: FumA C-terminus/TtdB family hydratase beta subunit [bacterium]
MIKLTTPIRDEQILSLKVGDQVALSGTLITGRDAAHKYMIENFIQRSEPPQSEREIYERLKSILDGSIIYHCGPVVDGLQTRQYRFVAAGPTTSSREEPYQADVIKHFRMKGVIGKGGMGAKTSAACVEQKACYFHAIGGAAVFLAQSVVKVSDVLKLEFGVPEAMWVIEVKDFPVVVTMDAHGGSLHRDIAAASAEVLKRLIGAH